MIYCGKSVLLLTAEVECSCNRRVVMAQNMKILVSSPHEASRLLSYGFGTKSERAVLVRMIIESSAVGTIAGFLTEMHKYETPHMRKLRDCIVSGSQYRTGLAKILQYGTTETLLAVLPWITRDEKYGEEAERALGRLASARNDQVAFRVLREIAPTERFQEWRMRFLRKLLARGCHEWLHGHYPDWCHTELSEKEADEMIAAVSRTGKVRWAAYLLHLAADNRRSISLHPLDSYGIRKYKDLRTELFSEQQRLRLADLVAAGSDVEDAHELIKEHKKMLGVELTADLRRRLVFAMARGVRAKNIQFYGWKVDAYIKMLLTDPAYRSFLEPKIETPQLKRLNRFIVAREQEAIERRRQREEAVQPKTPGEWG